MKAILLAGGMGTRLRPLTAHTPKPIVPIFNRPFLHYQIDLLKKVPDIDEAILSLNYQPNRIAEVLGDGSANGLALRYVVEPEPLGTGGAIKYASTGVTDTVVVFNGDVLTQIDLASVIRLHRERRARATIVLTPVENPMAYGLVETEPDGSVRRFVEKPTADSITTNNINAGVYVLEPDTFDRIPNGVPWSIERAYFPSLVERKETFVAYLYDGYWIDIGAPDKYTQVHRDIMDGTFRAAPFVGASARQQSISPTARVANGATIEGPCFIDEGVVVAKGARIGAYSAIGRDSVIEEGASIDGSILWPNCRVSSEASVIDAVLGRDCQIGRGARIASGTVLGDNSILSDYTRT
ncbi:MAG: NDP-sugar synthase [Acidobacteria bacterium]|nr:NDP-sugar synthase [Acidobacteriota bacterium]